MQSRELAGPSRVFTSLKQSYKGVLAASLGCAHLVSPEVSKSCDGWSPPGHGMNCVLQPAATLRKWPQGPVCLQAARKGEGLRWALGRKPAERNTICYDSGPHPPWQSTSPAGQQVLRTNHGTNPRGTKGSQAMPPSALSRELGVWGFSPTI